MTGVASDVVEVLEQDLLELLTPAVLASTNLEVLASSIVDLFGEYAAEETVELRHAIRDVADLLASNPADTDAAADRLLALTEVPS